MVFLGVNYIINFFIEIQFQFLFIVFRDTYLFDKSFIKISSFLLVELLHRLLQMRQVRDASFALFTFLTDKYFPVQIM